MDLGAFGQSAAQAATVEALAEHFFDAGTEALNTAFIGMEIREPDGIVLLGRNLPRGIERYESVGRPNDPVLASVSCHHAPQAMSVRELRAYARRHKLGAYMELLDYDVGRHYMCAPIVVGGELVGVLRFARREDRAFGTEELSIASALSLHVSTRMATLRARAAAVGCAPLSARSLEVAELAASGMTTAEIGRVLGVTANTVKKHLRIVYERLGVGSRVELALRLPAAVSRR